MSHMNTIVDFFSTYMYSHLATIVLEPTENVFFSGQMDTEVLFNLTVCMSLQGNNDLFNSR